MWAAGQGFSEWTLALSQHKETYAAIEKDVLAEIKQQHLKFPKYFYDDESQSSFFEKYPVEIVNLDAVYATRGSKGRQIMAGGLIVFPEEFVGRHFTGLGYNVLPLESRPIHVLFSVLMWLVIQGNDDPMLRLTRFGDRFAFEKGERGNFIETVLPDDFGTTGYFCRREQAIERHLELIPDSCKDRNEVLWQFNYWLEFSSDLRQYLWAHRPTDIEKARKILSVLPVVHIKAILRYLIQDYWTRYLGWPDLVNYRSGEYFLAEVKSSRDKLSEDQKNWIVGNFEELKLPFKIVKVHRKASK